MTERLRLPTMIDCTQDRPNLKVKSLAVGTAYDNKEVPDHDQPEAQCVTIAFELLSGHQVVCRLWDATTVNDVIRSLERHKRDVWP